MVRARTLPGPHGRELPASVVDPRSLAIGLAYTVAGEPILALIVDDKLAIWLPTEALDGLAEQLAFARAELARTAPITEGVPD